MRNKEERPAEQLSITEKLARSVGETDGFKRAAVIGEAVNIIAAQLDDDGHSALFALLMFLHESEHDHADTAAGYAFAFSPEGMNSAEAVWQQWSGERQVKL